MSSSVSWRRPPVDLSRELSTASGAPGVPGVGGRRRADRIGAVLFDYDLTLIHDVGSIRLVVEEVIHGMFFEYMKSADEKRPLARAIAEEACSLAKEHLERGEHPFKDMAKALPLNPWAALGSESIRLEWEPNVRMAERERFWERLPGLQRWLPEFRANVYREAFQKVAPFRISKREAMLLAVAVEVANTAVLRKSEVLRCSADIFQEGWRMHVNQAAELAREVERILHKARPDYVMMPHTADVLLDAKVKVYGLTNGLAVWQYGKESPLYFAAERRGVPWTLAHSHASSVGRSSKPDPGAVVDLFNRLPAFNGRHRFYGDAMLVVGDNPHTEILMSVLANERGLYVTRHGRVTAEPGPDRKRLRVIGAHYDVSYDGAPLMMTAGKQGADGTVGPVGGLGVPGSDLYASPEVVRKQMAAGNLVQFRDPAELYDLFPSAFERGARSRRRNGAMREPGNPKREAALGAALPIGDDDRSLREALSPVGPMLRYPVPQRPGPVRHLVQRVPVLRADPRGQSWATARGHVPLSRLQDDQVGRDGVVLDLGYYRKVMPIKWAEVPQLVHRIRAEENYLDVPSMSSFDVHRSLEIVGAPVAPLYGGDEREQLCRMTPSVTLLELQQKHWPSMKELADHLAAYVLAQWSIDFEEEAVRESSVRGRVPLLLPWRSAPPIVPSRLKSLQVRRPRWPVLRREEVIGDPSDLLDQMVYRDIDQSEDLYGSAELAVRQLLHEVGIGGSGDSHAAMFPHLIYLANQEARSLPALPMVLNHGDLQPGALRWHFAGTEPVYPITVEGFTLARPDHPYREIARLFSLWPEFDVAAGDYFIGRLLQGWRDIGRQGELGRDLAHVRKGVRAMQNVEDVRSVFVEAVRATRDEFLHADRASKILRGLNVLSRSNEVLQSKPLDERRITTAVAEYGNFVENQRSQFPIRSVVG